MQSLTLVPDGPAEQDESLGDEAIHERGVRIPAELLPDAERLVPRRSPEERHREVRHPPKSVTRPRDPCREKAVALTGNSP